MSIEPERARVTLHAIAEWAKKTSKRKWRLWDFDTVRDDQTVNGVRATGGSLNGPGAVAVGGLLYGNSGCAQRTVAESLQFGHNSVPRRRQFSTNRRWIPVVHLGKRGPMMLVLALFLLAAQAQLGRARTPTSTAQPQPANPPAATETLTYDHVHFGVPDPPKAVEWYAKYLGGKPGPAGEPNDRLLFGKIRFIFLKTDKPLPSAGSAVDHVALSFPDLSGKMKEFEAEGIKIVMPIKDEPGLYRHAFIEDPWGAKIEVLQDPEALGFHHVHLRAPDPQAAFKWYLDMFGGERGKLKGRVEGVKYGDVWILAEKGNATPSEGHTIDHIGWRTTTDLNAKAAELKGKGVKFTTEPRPFRDIHISYVEGPAVVKIELLQR